MMLQLKLFCTKNIFPVKYRHDFIFVNVAVEYLSYFNMPVVIFMKNKKVMELKLN